MYVCVFVLLIQTLDMRQSYLYTLYLSLLCRRKTPRHSSHCRSKEVVLRLPLNRILGNGFRFALQGLQGLPRRGKACLIAVGVYVDLIVMSIPRSCLRLVGLLPSMRRQLITMLSLSMVGAAMIGVMIQMRYANYCCYLRS